MSFDRRQILTGAGALTLAGMFGARVAANPHAAGPFEVDLDTAQWRERLTPQEFHILREAGTERAFTSPLNEEKRRGVYRCAGCSNRVYTSATKFESGTGWPSFYEAVEGSVGCAEDKSLFMTRTEVHCGRCGGHLGHVFDDGPEPTGKRHCINGAALDFKHVPKPA